MKQLFNWQHPAIAAVACLLVAMAGWSAWLCLAAPLIFTGREHAQAEYRWIEEFGGHRRAFLPWWGGFDLRIWGVHSWWWNLTLPWGISGIAFLVIGRLGG